MCGTNEKPEFWETAFVEKQEMFGFEAAPSALQANELFLQSNVQSVLVPGCGYGRNAQLFYKNGMSVTGIEISQTAIEMAHRHYGDSMTIYHGSVNDMPFDNLQYDGIFCYALIHLLDKEERKNLIRNCYSQLAVGGYTVFVAITKGAPMYGQGEFVEKDRYAMPYGVTLFFYDLDTIQEEFGDYGLYESTEIMENLPFYIVKCKKE